MKKDERLGDSIVNELMFNGQDILPDCPEFPEQAVEFLKGKQAAEVNRTVDRAVKCTALDTPAAMGFFLAVLTRVSDGRKRLCEERIRQMLSAGDTARYVNVVANWVSGIGKAGSFWEDCILLLVKGLGKEDGKQLKTLDCVVPLKCGEPRFLVKFLTCVAECVGPLEVLALEKSLHRLGSEKEAFIHFVLSFVLHPKGLYRVAGRRLWDDWHLENSDFDASELEAPQQCFFILSMLQDFGNPETRLPKVLPLLEKGTEEARAFLMRWLRPYLDDYMGHVIKVLDALKMDNKEVGMIRQYYRGRADRLRGREAMKELMPAYTHHRAFLEAVRQQKEHWEKQMKEAEKAHTPAWAGFMDTVVLARGSGWRDDKGKTRHLPQIRYSVPSRQMSQSLSPKEQDDWWNALLKDWDDTDGNH